MNDSAKPIESKMQDRFGLKRFLKDSSGVSAVFMGLSVIPAVMLIGAGIDFAQISREQPAFYGAVDNAALAIASDDRAAVTGLNTTDKAARILLLKNYAQSLLAATYKDKVVGQSAITVDLKITGSDVNLDATLTLPTKMMGLFTDTDTVTLHSNTTVKLAMRPIEMALVLDNTGSMKNDMVGLKDAANKLLATLYSDTATKNMSSPFIRVGLVPFAGAVRLDPNGFDFNLDWIDTTGANPISHINFNDPTWNNFTAWGKMKTNASTPLTWNGCVESRSALANGNNYITGDFAPSNTDINSKFPAYFNPDSPSWTTGSGTGLALNDWYNNSGSLQSQAYFNNNYINPYYNYSSSSTGPLVLAPSGTAKTGYDDSTIGRNNTDFATRFTNTKKYDGKIISAESYIASGTSWNVTKGPWVNCNAASVVAMTHTRAKIEAGISSMKAIGGTNIAEGLAWGMRVLSPGAPYTQAEGYDTASVGASVPPASTITGEAIAPYNGPRWQKILVLMTDGENDPYAGVTLKDTGTYYNSLGAVTTTTTGNLNRYLSTNYNAAGATLDTYTAQMCTSLKANGVTIYTVGFRVDNAAMRACATDADHYSYVTSTAALAAYFDHIGQDVLNKMVYVAK
jgi:Flp pilus assembly protein TadG